MTNYRQYRIYEMLPGIIVWGCFLSGIILSFVRPLWVIYFIILFDLYWVFRVIYFGFYLLLSWRTFNHTLRTDWAARVAGLGPRVQNYYHCVFLPIFNEDETVVRTTLEAICHSTFSTRQMVIVLAGEQRQSAHFHSLAERLQTEYADRFFAFVLTEHPADLPDEIPGKGSNLNYAGHQMQKWFDERNIPYGQVIVSAFDIDTVVHPSYFAYLTYEYVTHPNPTRASFQPIALYNNNIWESKGVVRIMAFGTTFWLLFALGRPELLVTFSSHSMSFQALVDVGFWQKNIVSEDSRIFFQCFLHYGGQYSVVPLYVPVSMDTVSDPSYAQSLKNLYKQQRRWAWGVEHLPYLLWHLPKHHEIPFRIRLSRLWAQWEGKFSWCTTSLFILVFGRLPLFVAADEVRRTVIFQNTPHILEWLMSLSMLGLLLSMILSLRLLPRPPVAHRHRAWFFMILQWILLPVSLILFSAVPAIDSTTRLMLGRYLGFNVSQKKRGGAVDLDASTLRS